MISRRHNMPSHLIILLATSWQLPFATGLVRALGADSPHPSPLETMADVTNDFGVCVLQLIASPGSNTVFSPYGLVSMALLVYEGTTGQSAAEIYNTLHLPWHRDIVRIGFRDLHRYLRSYFSSEGFLKGLVLSKANVPLRPSYIAVLRFYGFQPDTSITQPVLTTQSIVGNETTTATTNVPETTVSTVQPTLTTITEAMTTAPMPTTMGVTRETSQPGGDSGTTVAPETTTVMMSVTNPLPTEPEVTATEGPVSQTTTTSPSTTSAETTVTTMKPAETTTTHAATTTPMEPLTTTLAMTTEPLFKTTQDVSPLTTITPETTVMPLQPVETTTIVEETTKSETTATTPMDSQKTTLDMKNEEGTTTETVKTTMNETPIQEEQITTTPNPTATPKKATTITTNQETTTEVMQETQTDTTEMNIVTMINKIPPTLESMNMILNMNNNKDEKMEIPNSLLTTPENRINEATTEHFDTTMPEFVSFVTNEITTKEIYTDGSMPEAISFSNMFMDTTIPVEDFVILTTPPDLEVMTDSGTSMLEAFILLEDDKDEPQYSDVTSDNMINKRSTVVQQEVTNTPTPVNNSQVDLNKTNKTQSVSETSTGSLIGDVLMNSMINLDNKNKSSSESLSTESEQSPTDRSEDGMTGFPTLEPDTIIFPTIKDPRLRRSVKSEEKPGQLGNWVGGWGSSWHPSPTDQWFWTHSGDKLVPVLTYTAYLPFTELPELQASAIQLPLDDARYSLMILLPKNVRGLKQMLHSLQWYSLRTILKSFQQTPVYAVVPTFTIVKHVNLTPALHKLGIRNIFDAYLANLSELSSEPNLYVRSVEQVITISVQKYFNNYKWFEASASQVENHFLATHPFAYFVVDMETQVALIAGTLMDPLLRNS